MNYRSRDLTGRKYLLLPDGTRADSLRFTPLLEELRRLGCPGVAGDMTKEQLLELYEREVFTPALKTVPKHHGGPMPLSMIVAKQTADVVARQAAGGRSADSRPVPPPIATMRV